MAKKSKLKTPEWILEDYDSEAEYNKTKGISIKKNPGKIFKVRVCPKCNSEKVSVVLVGEEGKKADNWECHQCKWTGKNIKELELNENQFLERMEVQENKNGN